MGKRIVVVLLAGLMVFVSNASAAQRKKTVEIAPVVPKLTEKERAVIAAKIVEQLNSQIWTIALIPQGAKKPAPITDVLTFTGNGITSQYLISKGFGGSNYALNIEEDGSGVFETVQRNGNDDLAIWRGEVIGSSIRGILNLRYKDGSGITYDFSSTAVTPVTRPAPVVQPETKQE